MFLRVIKRIHIPDCGGFIFGQGQHTHALATRENGLQHLLRSMGNEDEHSLFRRFLYHLEKSVGRLLIHLFRQIEYHGLIPVGNRCERQLGNYGLSLSNGNQSVLRLYAYGALQIGFREIRVCDGKFPPVPDIRFRCRLFVRSLRSLVDREHEMNIRMDQFRHLSAGRALTARITVMRIAAVEILKVSQSQRQGTAPIVLIHEHGMSHSPAVSHRREYLRYRSISYDISKPHPTLSFLL